MPTAWIAMTDAVIDDDPGPGACWPARTRDRAGNIGEWSAPVCQRIDDAAPAMGAPSSSPTWLSRANSTMSYSVRITDDDRGTSYEIQSRISPAGLGQRAWTTVAPASSTGGYTTPNLAAGTEGCVRMRATNGVGNTSAWSATRCATVPVNDTY